MQWTIVDGLGLIPKVDPETCHHNFDTPRRGLLPLHRPRRGLIFMKTWRTLHSRQILHAPGAISVRGSVLPGSPGKTLPLPSGAELSSLPTRPPRPPKMKGIIKVLKRF